MISEFHLRAWQRIAEAEIVALCSQRSLALNVNYLRPKRASIAISVSCSRASNSIFLISRRPPSFIGSIVWLQRK